MKMCVLLICIALLLSSSNSSECSLTPYSTHVPASNESAIKVTFTPEVFQYFAVTMQSKFTDFILNDLVIPDMESVAQLLDVVTVTFDLTTIRATQLSIGSASIEVMPFVGVLAVLDEIYMEISADWEYTESEWPYIEDHGTLSASITGLSFAANFTMLASTDDDECPGALKVDFSQFESSFDDIDIEMRGGASWLYDIIIDAFSSVIAETFQEFLDSQLTTAVAAAIDSAFEQTNSMWPSLLSGDDAMHDDRFLEDMYTGSAFVQFSFHGTTQLVSDFDTLSPSRLPFPSAPPRISGDHHIQYFVSPVAWESFYKAFITLDWFHAALTSADLEDNPYQALLDLDTLSALVPQLEPWAGSGHTLEIDSRLTDVGVGIVMPVAVLLPFAGEMSLSVSETQEHLFDMSCSITTAAKAQTWRRTSDAGAEEVYFNLDLSLYDFNCTVSQSDIGDVTLTSDVDQLISIYLSSAVLPWLNEQGMDAVKPLNAEMFGDFDIVYGAGEDQQYVGFFAFLIDSSE